MTHEKLCEIAGTEFLWLIEYLEERGWPETIAVSELVEASTTRHRLHISFTQQVPYILPKLGYEYYASKNADGRWRMNKKRETLYRRSVS